MFLKNDTARAARLQEALARWPRPTIGLAGYSSYRVFGLLGYAAGLALASALVVHAELGPIMWLVLALVPAATFLGSIGLASAGLLSQEIIFYEKALLALGFTALALAVTGQPLVAGLDLATLGIGTFLAFGRVGCFRVSCCHGRPARLGIRYGWDHLATGFPERWVGRLIFPVQLLDGAASAGAVAVGTAVQLSGHLPGQPLAAYACVYGTARFAVEPARGDERPYRAGLSSAQWTAVASVFCVAAFRPAWWTLATAVGLGVTTVALAAARLTGRAPLLRLTSARHLAEVDAVLARLLRGGPSITTSEGLRLYLRDDDAMTLVLGLEKGALTARCARAIARQLGRQWTVFSVHAHGRDHDVSLAAGVAFDSLVQRA